MNVGIVGLGKMGNAVADRLVRGNNTVYGFDTMIRARQAARDVSVTIVDSIASITDTARIIWLMVPAGDAVDTVLKELRPHLKRGDIIVDGGNSKFTDSMRRAAVLIKDGIHFLDCGTSGGVQGRKMGFCLMVGGNKEAYDYIFPLFQAIAAPGGAIYVGRSGTGHYVKMVHNGIEYALLEAYAEGFQLIKEGIFKDSDLNLECISSVWNHGSIIRSFILELVNDIFKHNQDLTRVSGKINQTGMGKWTVEQAQKENVVIPVIEKAVEVRGWSQKTGGNYATKLVALLRNAFGGHSYETIDS